MSLVIPPRLRSLAVAWRNSSDVPAVGRRRGGVLEAQDGLFEAFGGGFAVGFVGFDADGVSLEVAGGYEGGAAAGEGVKDSSCWWAGVFDQGCEEGDGFLGGVDGVSVAGSGFDDAGHQPGAAVLGDEGAVFDGPGVGGTFFASDGAFGGVHCDLDGFVNGLPGAAVEVQGVFVDAAKAVGVEVTAVVLLPDDVLGEFPVGEFGGVLQEHAEGSADPHRRGLDQVDPALLPPVPRQGGFPVRRIGHNDIGGQGRQQVSAIGVVQGDGFGLEVRFHSGQSSQRLREKAAAPVKLSQPWRRPVRASQVQGEGMLPV